jgi:hypothetical protein
VSNKRKRRRAEQQARRKKRTQRDKLNELLERTRQEGLPPLEEIERVLGDDK